MKAIAKILEETRNSSRPKNLSTEFQHYGVFLTEQLGDTRRYSLYIKLAKTVDRALLEEALNYAKGYTNAKSKAKIFMWKLKQLQENENLKNQINADNEAR